MQEISEALKNLRFHFEKFKILLNFSKKKW